MVFAYMQHSCAYPLLLKYAAPFISVLALAQEDLSFSFYFDFLRLCSIIQHAQTWEELEVDLLRAGLEGCGLLCRPAQSSRVFF